MLLPLAPKNLHLHPSILSLADKLHLHIYVETRDGSPHISDLILQVSALSSVLLLSMLYTRFVTETRAVEAVANCHIAISQPFVIMTSFSL